MPTKRLTADQITLLSREIQAVIDAGVPLGGIADLNFRDRSQDRIDDVSRRIAEQVRQGTPLPEALEHVQELPPEFRAILVAGVRCGRSQDVLEQVGDLASMLSSLQKTLRRGMLYPTFVVIIAAALFAMILVQFVPRLNNLYRFLKLEVPPADLWIEQAGIWPAIAVAVVVLLFLWLFRRSVISATFTGHGLRLPGSRRLHHDVEYAHLTALLSLLVRYEVPLPEALRLTGATLASVRQRAEFDALADAIERGEPLSQAIANHWSLPRFLRWQILTGAQNSQLPESLSQAAEFYRERAVVRAHMIQRIIPAAMVLVVGGGVTMLYALSVVIPITQLLTRLAEHS